MYKKFRILSLIWIIGFYERLCFGVRGVGLFMKGR